MQEQVISLDTPVNEGVCICAYGPIGVGKTEALLTLPDRLMIISNEPKDIKRTLRSGLKRRKEEDRKIKVITDLGDFDSYVSYLAGLRQLFLDGKRPCDSLGFDTISFVSSEFKTDIEDDRFKKDFAADQKRKNLLVDRFRFEIPDWGSIASMMKRATWLLNKLSTYGVNVVANAGMIEYPSYNRALEAAPNFQGKEYASIMAGFFDLVGIVRKNPKTPTGFPPTIAFTSADDSYVCRNCHERTAGDAGKPVDYSKIIAAIKS
jgi:hypothetical protein